MRRHTHRGELILARFSVSALVAVCAMTPLVAFAQAFPSNTPGSASAALSSTPPTIQIGRSAISFPERTRRPFRDSSDNAVCVAPESVAAALGVTYNTDLKNNKAYFLNTETGNTVTVTLRTAPEGSDLQGAFIPIVEVSEALGAKCQYDNKTNTLYVRSVLTSVEMLGSQLRVKGTLPLWPRITRMEDGKTVAFDFAGAEIGSLPRKLENLGPGVSKARTGQFDDNTARIVLEMNSTKSFAWLAAAQPSSLAVLSSAPGTENIPGSTGEVATTTPTPTTQDPGTGVAAPVTVTMGADGKPLPPPAPVKTPSRPVGKAAVPTLLKGVRFVNVSDTQARIIVDAPNAPAVRALLAGGRLTLDIGNSLFGPGTQTTLPEATHPLLKGVQTVNTSATTAQLMIDLSRAVNFTVRLDPKGGFTVDLTLPRGAGGRIAGKLIVVDAGHGGHDAGAPGVNGTHEKNVTLAIARQVANELHDRGANVIMTRDSDSFVELGERSDIANRTKADLFVSVHADSAGHSANGSTVYYHLNDASERTLAQCVAERFRNMGGIRTYGSRSDGAIYGSGFSVLRRTKTLAILCECGYMSNGHDVALLNDLSMQGKIARSIASGIQDYIEGNSSAAVVANPEPSIVVTPPSASSEETHTDAEGGNNTDTSRVPAPSDQPQR